MRTRALPRLRSPQTKANFIAVAACAVVSAAGAASLLHSGSKFTSLDVPSTFCYNYSTKHYEADSIESTFVLNMDRTGGLTQFYDDGGLYDTTQNVTLTVAHKGCRCEYHPIGACLPDEDGNLVPEKRAWFSSSNNYVRNGLHTTNHAMGLEFEGTKYKWPSSDMTTDKYMWTLQSKRATAGAVEMGQRRYNGFAIKIADSSERIESPGENYMIAQYWQGSPFSPPISLHLNENPDEEIDDPHETYQLELRRQDKCSPKNEIVHPNKFVLEKGEWYEIIFGFKGEYEAENGWASVWIRSPGSNTYYREMHWSGFSSAYDPTCTEPPPKPPEEMTDKDWKKLRTPNDTLNFTFGLYRRRQPTYMKMFFDDVRTAGSFAGAAFGIPNVNHPQ